MRLLQRYAAYLVLLSVTICPMCATETPLVIEGAGLMGVIEPGVGTVTLFELSGQQLVRYGSANFLTDLRLLRDRPYDEQNGITYSYLRIGSVNFLPSGADILNMLPGQQTAEEKAKNLPSYRERANKAENDFWAKPAEYDGVVRGAFSQKSLFLAIPCLHALLVYEIQDRNKGPVLRGYRNVGLDLMIPQGYKTVPTPQDIFNQLPPAERAAREKDKEDAFKKAGEKAGSLSLQACDWWLSASGDRFALLDFANKHIVTYYYDGKRIVMESSRNIDIDQLIPSGMSTKPLPQDAFVQFAALYKAQLEEFKFPLDQENLAALVSQSTVSNVAKVSPVQALAKGNDLILNFTDLHKIFVYRIQGAGNSLELVSVRDTTVDTGLALLANRMSSRIRGNEAFQSCIAELGKHMEGSAMMSLKFALKEEPSLVAKAEKESQLKLLHKNPDWQATIDDAKKRAAAEEEQRLARIKLVEEMRLKKQPPKGK